MKISALIGSLRTKIGDGFPGLNEDQLNQQQTKDELPAKTKQIAKRRVNFYF